MLAVLITRLSCSENSNNIFHSSGGAYHWKTGQENKNTGKKYAWSLESFKDDLTSCKHYSDVGNNTTRVDDVKSSYPLF